MNKHWVKDNAKFFSIFLLVGQSFYTLADCFVDVVVLYTLDIIANIKFLLESEVELFGFSIELDIDVQLVFFDLFEDLVDDFKDTCLHGLLEALLTLLDAGVAALTTADRLLPVHTVDIFKHAVSDAALLAVELVAFLAVKLGVLE